MNRKAKNMETKKKIIKEQILELYEKDWLLTWIAIILIFVAIDINLKKFFFSLPQTLYSYFQTIFLGLTTFSIPLLWNLYNRILEIKSEAREKDIESVLIKQFYKKLDRSFHIFLLIPLTLFLLTGLIFPYWLSPVLNWIMLVVSCFFILFSTQIYNWIENKSKVSLEEFIVQNSIDEDLIIIFKELFEMTDNKIETKFNIHPKELMNLFTKKMGEGIENEEKQNFIDKLLFIFQVNFENRTLLDIFISDFWKEFLKWHLNIWKKSFSLPDTIVTYSYLQNIFRNIFKKVLMEESAEYDIFFEEFTNHINNNIGEKIIKEQERQKEKLYIKEFLRDFCNILFEEGPNSPHHFYLWEMIPYNWKITPENLKEKIVSRIMCNEFFIWAERRIHNNIERRYDKSLDEVARELFPETEPILWAEILTFVLSEYEPENRVKSFIERPLTFGLISRTYTYWVSPNRREEELEEAFKKEKEKQIRNTFKLVKILFPKLFVDIEKKHMREIESKEKEYKEDAVKYRRLQRLKTIFNGILKSMD